MREGLNTDLSSITMWPGVGHDTVAEGMILIVDFLTKVDFKSNFRV